MCCGIRRPSFLDVVLVEHVGDVTPDGSTKRTHVEGVTGTEVEGTTQTAAVRFYDVHLLTEVEVRTRERVVTVVTIVQRIFTADAEAFERFEEDTEVSRRLRLTADVDTLHVDDGPSVVIGTDLGTLTVSRHGKSVFVVSTTDDGVTVPFPVTKRYHGT